MNCHESQGSEWHLRDDDRPELAPGLVDQGGWLVGWGGGFLTILFCTGVYYTRTCVCKFCQFYAIFFAQEAFLVATFFYVVYLYCLIARRRHK